MKACVKCGKMIEDLSTVCSYCSAIQAGGADKEQSLLQIWRNRQKERAPSSQEPSETTTDLQKPEDMPKAETAKAFSSPKTVRKEESMSTSEENREKPAEKSSRLNSLKSKANNPKAFLIIAAIVIAAVIIIVLLANFFLSPGGISSNKAAEAYVEAIKKNSGTALIDATCTGPMKEAVAKIQENRHKRLSMLFEYYLGYEDLEYRSLMISDPTELPREAVTELVEKLQNYSPDVKINALYRVRLSYEYRYGGAGTWDTHSETIYVYKAGAKYFVYPAALTDIPITDDQADVAG